jgi:hypothetical protein
MGGLMELHKVHIQAPVTVRACHLRFAGDVGAEQFRRRSHVLQKVDGASGVFRLEGETMFKAGEIIETDFEFPKGMLGKVQIEKPKAKQKAAA